LDAQRASSIDVIAKFQPVKGQRKKRKCNAIPPTTEPLSGNLLDKTFFRTLADEKKRQAV
jgi:hypothetical protein